MWGKKVDVKGKRFVTDAQRVVCQRRTDIFLSVIPRVVHLR